MVHKYSESTSIPLSTFLSGTRSIAFNFSLGLTSPAVHSVMRCPFPAHLRQTPIFVAHLIHPNLLRRPSLMTRPPPRLTFEVRKVFSLGELLTTDLAVGFVRFIAVLMRRLVLCLFVTMIGGTLVCVRSC